MELGTTRLEGPAADLRATSPASALAESPSGSSACKRPAVSDAKPPTAAKSTHWAVVTTIFKETEAITKFLDCWPTARIVVVGDCKSDDSFWHGVETDRLIYLSPQGQDLLGYKTLGLTPWNHFGRKSIGFMFAVQHGAEHVFDFDDDNHVKCGANDLFKRLYSDTDGLPAQTIQSKHYVHNPYIWFSPVVRSDGNDRSEFIWPRGFPLSMIGDQETYIDDSIRDADGTVSNMNVAILQGLADHDPDVDAIYRMTRPLPIYFTKYPGLARVLPRGVFSPWNAQAVVVRKNALWSLLLPITVNGRVSDIWRSYFVTALMWLSGHQVAFTEAIVTQYRNPHVYMKDYKDETDLYEKTESLIQTIAGWLETEGLTVKTMQEAYVNLIRHLADHHDTFIGQKDVALAEAWVADLATVGYEWPRLLAPDKRRVTIQLRQQKEIDGRSEKVTR